MTRSDVIMVIGEGLLMVLILSLWASLGSLVRAVNALQRIATGLEPRPSNGRHAASRSTPARPRPELEYVQLGDVIGGTTHDATAGRRS